MMKNFGRLLILALIFTGCAQKPTKVYQSSQIQSKENSEISEVHITEQTVLIDARPAFDYSVAHLSGAINLRPEDFSQREKPFLGLLEVDLYFHTRKLARMGISPETPVLVVGRGLSGEGEEGRVAWTLKYIGIKHVGFVGAEYFKLPLVTAESEPRQPVALWKPQLDSSLIATKKEFIRKSMKVHPDFLVIDARSAGEYLGKVQSKHVKETPDVGAINIPWTDFFEGAGVINVKVKDKLQAVGITTDKKIYVIGNQGVESAAVTMALRELGYSKAANYAGGYLELMSASR